MLQSCVDHVSWPYLLFWAVDYGKHAWQLFGTVFKQIHAQRRTASGCFGFNAGFYQLFAAVKLKQREKNVVLVALLLQSIIKIWSSKGNERSWRFSHCITFHRTMRWCGHSFKPKAIIVVLAFLKVGFNNRKFSPGASNLITARRTNPTWLIFRLQNGKTKIFLNFLHKVSIKRFSVALPEQEDCSVLSTYEEHPHILQ